MNPVLHLGRVRLASKEPSALFLQTCYVMCNFKKKNKKAKDNTIPYTNFYDLRSPNLQCIGLDCVSKIIFFSVNALNFFSVEKDFVLYWGLIVI